MLIVIKAGANEAQRQEVRDRVKRARGAILVEAGYALVVQGDEDAIKAEVRRFADVYPRLSPKQANKLLRRRPDLEEIVSKVVREAYGASQMRERGMAMTARA